MTWAALGLGSSDYDHNVRIVLARVGCDPKHFGILASIPATYHRAIGRELTRAAEANAADGGHWGEIGKRATVKATLMRVGYSDGMYGRIAICTFRTAEGSDLVWFASGSAPGLADVGTVYSVKATPKRHDSRNGRAQTVISRASLSAAAEMAA
jgi:hypothetical protein